MTRPDGEAFDLVYFWMSLVGQKNKPQKNVTLLGWLDDNVDQNSDADYSISFDIGGMFSDFASKAMVQFWPGDSGTDNDPDQACLDTTICSGVGYLVTLKQDWTGLGEVIWAVNQEGQATLDCIGLRRDSQSTVADGCTPGTTPIPIPAAGWMMIAGIGGLAAVRRRRKA